MRATMLFAFLLAALSCVLTPELLKAEEDGFKPIFNGKDLNGWSGNGKFWRVEDGAITGETTPNNPTRGNTFVIWNQGQVDDFELTLSYRIFGGNSGIQYRSTDLGNFVVGGHQADFEAGDKWSGTHYHEKGRGVLAARGEKTEIALEGRPKVIEKLGASNELQAKIKKEDWNEYHIIALGKRMIHKINGVVMTDVTDGHKSASRSGILALQLHAGPPMKVQFKDIRLKRLPMEGKKKVVFMAGRDSHGRGSHEHRGGCALLALALNENVPNVHATVYFEGWPQDPTALDNADALVMYADGGGGHPVNRQLERVDAYVKDGMGVACIHYGVEVPKGPSGEKFLDWIGGYFEAHWSVNPHWTANFKTFPEHAITRGVKPFSIEDEWYYHMRFRPEMKGVTPLLTDLPPKESLSRGDGAHSGNPHVRAAVLERKEKQHMAWCSENEGGSRGFGITGGHFHRSWGDDNFRKLVLNGLVWVAQADVPAEGVSSKSLTQADLEGFLNLPRKTAGVTSPPKSQTITIAPNVKPKFKSEIINKDTAGHAVDIDVDITGAKILTLVVDDGGNGATNDWGNWAEPRLIGKKGELKLTVIRPTRIQQSSLGKARLNGNTAGRKMKIDGKPVPYGIGTHANCVITYKVPEGYTQFKARGGLDDESVAQAGSKSSVRFSVYAGEAAPTLTVASGNRPGNAPVSRDPALAVGGLDVAEGLEATLFAAEPMMLNPSNIEIDHRGRIWVCEIVNYRGHRNRRAEGDRILILEDTTGDGRADKTTTFYQGRDIDSPHGICVLPTPDGKGTRAIVSAGANVFIMTDEDGDLKADRKEVFFTGISGAQHDHGIHAFVFGPDGKLYFNFGNAGRQIKDKDGKSVVDAAGNEVAAHRKPYQEGMVFRCNSDGSEFETLGWNFRNNWMATVDSFGTIWQSDNDDDGNRGVRINFVMEFGNYGYKDEFTGAGWKAKRTGMHAEVPKRHWHLKDPGVVPNLLQTGAGSPTGITVYEGDLLPEVFHGQVLHCDAGPNVCRAYPVNEDGAGYKAEVVNILHGARDKWFRPADVAVAPDGSIFIADWYDPGVGGHRAGHIDSGRLFRVAPPGNKYSVPELDFSTPSGAVTALKNPNYTVRYMAWTALVAMGVEKVAPELKKLLNDENPRYRARAFWIMSKFAPDSIVDRIGDEDPNIRITALRAARQMKVDLMPMLKKSVTDESPQVRREAAVTIRHLTHGDLSESQIKELGGLWAELAVGHDGKDRWYLEALGIAAQKHPDAFFGSWLAKVGDGWNTPAGRDIIWRVRAKAAPMLLAKIIKSVAASDHPRYYRALDFHSGPEKDKALQAILTP
ncbi:MAG: PVC-type heme-binding CxxCH protein [Pirellulales bacterium]